MESLCVRLLQSVNNLGVVDSSSDQTYNLAMKLAVDNEATMLLTHLATKRDRFVTDGMYHLRRAVKTGKGTAAGALLTLWSWDFKQPDSVKSFYKLINTACYHGQLSSVQKLYEFLCGRNDCERFQVDSIMRAGLNFAAHGGHVNIMEWLCNQAGGKLNISEFHLTPLHCACMNGQYKCLVWLHTNGANLDVRNGDHGCTPIFPAVIQNQFRCVEFLHKHGANLHAQDNWGQTLLFYARTESMLRWLLTNGVNPNLKNRAQESPVHHHSRKGNRVLVAILQEFMDPEEFRKDMNRALNFNYNSGRLKRPRESDNEDSPEKRAKLSNGYESNHKNHESEENGKRYETNGTTNGTHSTNGTRSNGDLTNGSSHTAGSKSNGHEYFEQDIHRSKNSATSH